MNLREFKGSGLIVLKMTGLQAVIYKPFKTNNPDPLNYATNTDHRGHIVVAAFHP